MTTHDLINECAELFRAHDLVGTVFLLENAKKCIPDVTMVPPLTDSRPEGMPEEPQKVRNMRVQPLQFIRNRYSEYMGAYVEASLLHIDALRRHAEELSVELERWKAHIHRADQQAADNLSRALAAEAAKETIRKGDYEAIKELQRQVEMWKGFAKDAEADLATERHVLSLANARLLAAEERAERYNKELDEALFTLAKAVDAKLAAEADAGRLREALDHILWIKDCGTDGKNEHGEFVNHADVERDAMYGIARAALAHPAAEEKP